MREIGDVAQFIGAIIFNKNVQKLNMMLYEAYKRIEWSKVDRSKAFSFFLSFNTEFQIIRYAFDKFVRPRFELRTLLYHILYYLYVVKTCMKFVLYRMPLLYNASSCMGKRTK